MDRQELSQKLTEWMKEFEEFHMMITEEPLVKFLTNRLLESGVLDEDPDIVRVKFSDKYVKVRIQGLVKTAHGAKLQCEGIDSPSMMLIDLKSLHPDDEHKAALALDRIEGATA